MSFSTMKAGPGCRYYIDQVAVGDGTRGRMPLADYYDLKGEAPGHWFGAGLAGLGLAEGDVVTEEQMLALFGRGEHPLSAQRFADMGPDATAAERRQAVRIGRPFRQPDEASSAFQDSLNQHYIAWNLDHDRPRHAPVPDEVRAMIRTQLATAWFTQIHGRPPDARELYGFLAKVSRPPATPVSGFDATFSPMKSVSTLWAVADHDTAARIELAHDLAVREALAFIASKKTLTRRGHAGAEQVETRGLIAAVFTHRDTRAGDPDLHTHVLIANKVQAASDGEWLSLDGRPLHKAITAASETYNTALQARLTELLGVAWQDAPRPDDRQPVREIVGIDKRLMEAWSKRRADITEMAGELAMAFQHDHGRPPTASERQDLYQRATLETREAEHELRSRNEQRASWRAQADKILGRHGVEAMLATVFSQTPAPAPVLDASWFTRTAELVLAGVEARRGQWQEVHVRAEAQRQVRTAGVRAGDLGDVVEQLIGRALGRSVLLTPPSDGIQEPSALRRLDGSSVYRVAGSDWFTSQRMLWAEQRIIDSAGRTGGRAADPNSVETMLLASRASQAPLNTSQTGMVVAMATSGRRVQLCLAPAGSGKTTAMHALTTAWTNSGGNVIGLAPSATAAKQLGQALGDDAPSETLHKLARELSVANPAEWVERITAKTLVIIDEAGMADTLILDHVIGYALDHGASVRLIGDDQQLGAIASGGVLRDIATQHGAIRLDEVLRFHDPAERTASLALREGDPGALGFYYDQQRVHVGDSTTATAGLFEAWLDDKRRGLDALMLAPTKDRVAALNQQARSHRLRDTKPGPEVALSDGNRASRGDTILTRHNNRRLRAGGDGWVRNGDRWTVLEVHHDGSLGVRHTRTGRKAALPANYVAEHTELGYATTIHTAQGVTAETCHGLATDAMSRQQLYTMLTRGRQANHVWLVTADQGDPETRFHPSIISPPTPNEMLEKILARDEAPVSVTTQLTRAIDPATLLGEAVLRYHDAVRHAAASFAGADVAAGLERAAEATGIPLLDADAWKVLRSHLLVLQANGLDAANVLVSAAAEDGVEDARDPAAVIDYRIDIHDLRDSDARRPLAWLPGVPKLLATDPTWADYLARRADLIGALRTQLRDQMTAADTLPRWAQELTEPPSREVIADIEIWRAAHQIPDSDLRPTGPVRTHLPEARIQHRLDGELAHEPVEVLNWVDRIHEVFPDTAGDPGVLRTARAFAKSDADGEWLPARLSRAAARPLPDEHKADALRARLDGWLTFERVLPTPQGSMPHTDPHRHEVPRMSGPTRSPAIGR